MDSVTGPDTASRREDWERRLGRLRLGAEPIEEQVARYRRVTLALTAVVAAVAAGFVILFAAFGRPGLGAILSAVLFAPVLAFAWFDQARMERLAAAYLREQASANRGEEEER